MLFAVILLFAVVVLVSTDAAEEAPPERGAPEIVKRKMRTD